MGELQEEITMRCAICGGELKDKIVTEEIAEGNDRVVTKVRANVCEDCHERYYQEGVVDNLIRLKETLSKKKLKLQQVGKVYEVE